jgi:hypothetical protein
LTELHSFNGGVADTSTLIYLERLGLLDLAARCFSLWIIPQVTVEYGTTPTGTILLTSGPSGLADEVLCQVAQILRQPVLSEDRHVLRDARACNLPYYNTLMIILAFCVRGHLAIGSYGEIRRDLLTFARYGPQVVSMGDAVFRALEQSLSSDSQESRVSLPAATPAPEPLHR